MLYNKYMKRDMEKINVQFLFLCLFIYFYKNNS